VKALLWTRNAPRSDARSEARAEALGPGPDEVRPVLSLSKGRDDGEGNRLARGANRA